MKHKSKDWEANQMTVVIGAFLANYNKNLPEGFPQASLALLRKFQTSHPTLFKKPEDWSIDKHRKKVMDWLLLQQNVS